MGASIEEIKSWFDSGAERKAVYMIVVCDSFDYEDYPVYLMPNDDFYEKHDSIKEENMQRIMEVYDLKKSWKSQSKGRVYNYPKR